MLLEQAAGIPCPEGFYCTGAQADKAPCTCSVGYYCPEGSPEAPGVPCPAGFSCPGAPSNGLSACPAAPGAFCPPGDTDNIPDACPQVTSPECGRALRRCDGLCLPAPERESEQMPIGDSLACVQGQYCDGGSAQPKPCTSPPGNFCPPASSGPAGTVCPMQYFCTGATADKQVCAFVKAKAE